MRSVRHYPGFFGVTVLCLIVLYAPLVVVMVYSFNDSPSITTWGGVSLRWYVDVFTGPEAAALQGGGVEFAQHCLSGRDHRHRHRHSGGAGDAAGGQVQGAVATFALINMPLMVPEIVIAVATLIFFTMIGSDHRLSDHPDRPHHLLHSVCLPAHRRPTAGHRRQLRSRRPRSVRHPRAVVLSDPAAASGTGSGVGIPSGLHHQP